MAPIKESSASCSPLITSGSTPSIALTPSMKSSLLAASLVALVAQNLIAWTPRFLISLANNSVALKVLSIASG